MILMQLHCHLVNEYEIMAAIEKHCQLLSTQEDHIFSSPVGTPRIIAIKVQQTFVLVQNLSQMCSAVLEEMCAKQTDRQTGKQQTLYPPISIGEIRIRVIVLFCFTHVVSW